MFFLHIFNKSIQFFFLDFSFSIFYYLINTKIPKIEVVLGMSFNIVHFQTAHANNLAGVEENFQLKLTRTANSRDESPSKNKMALTLNKMAGEKDRNLIDQLETVTRLAAVEMEFLAEIEKISQEKVLQIQWDKEKDYLG